MLSITIGVLSGADGVMLEVAASLTLEVAATTVCADSAVVLGVTGAFGAVSALLFS